MLQLYKMVRPHLENYIKFWSHHEAGKSAEKDEDVTRIQGPVLKGEVEQAKTLFLGVQATEW